jgi:hypothetical protein
LYVVGFSTTRTPFDSVHSVMPSPSFAAVFATLPGFGNGSSSGLALTVSTYAVSLSPPADLITAASAVSSGTVTPSFFGALTATTRLRSGIQSRASAFTSASVISGRKRCTSAFS